MEARLRRGHHLPCFPAGFKFPFIHSAHLGWPELDPAAHLRHRPQAAHHPRRPARLHRPLSPARPATAAATRGYRLSDSALLAGREARQPIRPRTAGRSRYGPSSDPAVRPGSFPPRPGAALSSTFTPRKPLPIPTYVPRRSSPGCTLWSFCFPNGLHSCSAASLVAMCPICSAKHGLTRLFEEFCHCLLRPA